MMLEVAKAEAVRSLENEKAEMVGRLEQWSNFLEAMNRISLAFHQRLDLEAVLDVICKESAALFQVDIATVHLREGGGFVQRAAFGASIVEQRIERRPMDPSEAQLVSIGGPFFINRFQEHPLARHDVTLRYRAQQPTQSLMVIPILDRSEVIGVLTLADRVHLDRFSSQDLEKGKLLGEQAARALINARLYERVAQSNLLVRQHDRFRILGELAGVVAHEIKNALTPLRTLTDLLNERHQDAGFREWYSTTVREEIERMYRLVSQLNRFQRPEKRVAEPVALHELLHEVVQLLRPEASGRQTALELAGEPVPPIPVVPNELRQVLLNLILNAIQAVEQDGIVTVGTRRGERGAVVFWVSDTGPGIPADKLQEIFDPLYTTRDEGTGLGLAVARDLVKAHGGKIEVESRPGAGTTFTVTLPSVCALSA